jgi:hypothetical protein
MISIDDMVDRHTQALLDAQEDDQLAKEQAGHERWLMDVYAEAFESAYGWVDGNDDCDYTSTCSAIFKDFMRDHGLSLEEQYQLLDWLSEDERFEQQG